MHIGMGVQMARAMAGIDRDDLANALEITSGEMKAYECGDVRISAAVLFTIAQTLKHPIDYFY
jgi:transcriptional regulator with XRE-family HTH domain